MDDKPNVKAAFRQFPRIAFCTALQRGEVDDHSKAKQLPKYAKQCFIWQAICSCGINSMIFIITDTNNQ